LYHDIFSLLIKAEAKSAFCARPAWIRAREKNAEVCEEGQSISIHQPDWQSGQKTELLKRMGKNVILKYDIK